MQAYRKSIKGKIDNKEEKKRRIDISKQNYEDNHKKLGFRVNLDEYDLLIKRAEKLNVKLNEYLRHKLIDGSDKMFISKIDIQTLNEINKIGVNLNQVAKTLNTYKKDTRIEGIEIKLEEIKHSLKLIANEIRK